MSDSKDKSDEITTSENPSSPPDSILDQSPALPDNPHSMPKQLTGIVISSVIIIIVTFPYLVIGVLLALTGIFTFLDAWNSGIYKKPGKRALTNNSPMVWGLMVMLLWIISYPIYLFNRNKLKTKDGPRAYWILIHVFSAPILILVALQGFAMLLGYPIE